MQIIGPLLQALTYPRRRIWSALGLPGHGNQILGMLGFNPNTTATHMAGTALEIMGDPLAWASGPLLSALGAGDSAMSQLNPAVAGAVDDALLAMVNGNPQQPDEGRQQPSDYPQLVQAQRHLR